MQRTLAVLAVLVTGVASGAPGAPGAPEFLPPETPAHAVVDVLHGTTLTDR